MRMTLISPRTPLDLHTNGTCRSMGPACASTSLIAACHHMLSCHSEVQRSWKSALVSRCGMHCQSALMLCRCRCKAHVSLVRHAASKHGHPHVKTIATGLVLALLFPSSHLQVQYQYNLNDVSSYIYEQCTYMCIVHTIHTIYIYIYTVR